MHVSMKIGTRLLSVALMMVSHLAAGEETSGKLTNPRSRTLNVKELPAVQWQAEVENPIRERAEMALREGPDALEKLYRQLAEAETKDKDGRYNSVHFFDVIANDGEPVNGEPRLAYGMRISEEWRKRYPESKAAMLAQARIYSGLGFFAKRSGLGAESMDANWKVAEELMNRSLALLGECRDGLKKEPEWYATYFMLIIKMDSKREEFQKVADALAANIPDDGYALSKAVRYLYPGNFGEPGEWSAWLKKQMEKYPAQERAKQYARTIFEQAARDGFDTAGPRFMWQAPLDRDLLVAGIDALEKQYPDSIYMHSAGAATYAFCLRERQGAFDCLKRAKGQIHQDFFYSKGRYDSAVAFLAEVPWDIGEAGGIPITHRTYGKDPAFAKMMDEAAAQGPEALEKLIQELRTPERLRDKDGLYQSMAFFDWFGEKTLSLADEKRRIKKEELLKKWSIEYPASPFVKLAWAEYWVTHAWNARSGEVASQVSDMQAQAFAKRLETARDYLMECRELQDSEPAWSVTALTVMLGEGADRKEFNEVSELVFEKFPECEAAIGATMEILQPRWGGRSGEWEPWLRKRLENLPAKDRSIAYANAIITVIGYARSSQEGYQSVLGGKDPDKAMLLDGLRRLVEKFPDSPRFANAQAMIYSNYTDDDAGTAKAIDRMNGTIDMRVWYSYSRYEPCERRIARIKTESLLKKQSP